MFSEDACDLFVYEQSRDEDMCNFSLQSSVDDNSLNGQFHAHLALNLPFSLKSSIDSCVDSCEGMEGIRQKELCSSKFGTESTHLAISLPNSAVEQPWGDSITPSLKSSIDSCESEGGIFYSQKEICLTHFSSDSMSNNKDTSGHKETSGRLLSDEIANELEIHLENGTFPKNGKSQKTNASIIISSLEEKLKQERLLSLEQVKVFNATLNWKIQEIIKNLEEDHENEIRDIRRDCDRRVAFATKVYGI